MCCSVCCRCIPRAGLSTLTTTDTDQSFLQHTELTTLSASTDFIQLISFSELLSYLDGVILSDGCSSKLRPVFVTPTLDPGVPIPAPRRCHFFLCVSSHHTNVLMLDLCTSYIDYTSYKMCMKISANK